MPIIARNESGPGFQPTPGLANAVCCRIIDLGTVSGFQGKMQHKIMIVWELEERIVASGSQYDGQRFVRTRDYTLSLSERANLRRDLQSWRGRQFTETELEAGFDLEVLLGKPCTINLIAETKEGKTYVNIAGIMPPIKGSEHLTSELPSDWMPQWVKDKVGTFAPLDAAENAPAYVGETFDDDIPF